MQACGDAGLQTIDCEFACVGKACGGVCVPYSKECVSNSTFRACTREGQWDDPLPCPLPSPNPECSTGNCAYHAGHDVEGATTDTLFGGYLYAVRFRVTAQTRAYRLGMFGSMIGKSARLALFSEGSNLLPKTLMGSTGVIASADGVMEAPTSATVTLNAATNYWIVAIANTDLGMSVSPSGPGYALFNNPPGWPEFPSQFPSGATLSTNVTPDFYVVLQDF